MFIATLVVQLLYLTLVMQGPRFSDSKIIILIVFDEFIITVILSTLIVFDLLNSMSLYLHEGKYVF
jgi:hypothetical protein